jgi:hypothetical protein
MKKLFAIIAAAIIAVGVFAQSPNKMSYQAVVRNGSGVLIQSANIGIRVSILKDSINGTAVYIETHTATTNANGLVTIKIGGGTPVAGIFANIDWATGTYFAKTEVDPTGGTTYTITGTSQLLSVPYALHANTADGITGGITETDPLFSASVANAITAADTAKWSAPIHHIGESYGDGIVFYVYDGGRHGLIAFTSTLGPLRWDAGTNLNTIAFRDGIGTGKENTDLIIAVQGLGDGGNYAAKICTFMSTGGDFGDWYLPSKWELYQLYNQNIALGLGLGTAYYWSSSEYNSADAYFVDFAVGSAGHTAKTGVYYIRPIRAF